MKAFRKYIYILILVVVLVQSYLLFSAKDEQQLEGKKVVAVSSFTLHDVLRHIAQGSVEIVNILPLGVDPHSFEPTPKLMAAIEKSDIVFYSGAGLEPWTHGFAFKNRAVDVSAHVKLKELYEDEHEHEHEKDHKECAHEGVDPHYWLDFKNMQRVALLVRDELTTLEPQNAQMYASNAKKYVEMLEKLDAEYAKVLSACKLDLVVINHNALGYLSDAYNFDVESLSGLSPEDQPSPKDFMRLFEHIKDDNITTIFFENFVSDKAIRAVANDANVSLEIFQTLGNITADEMKKDLSYEDIMYLNLEKLSKALMCN